MSFLKIRKWGWVALSAAVLAGAVGSWYLFNKQNKNKKFDPAFAQYISGFTGGTVSKSTTIQVRFRTDACPEGQIGQPAEQGLFDFSPGIEGEAYWIDKNTLEFRPAQHLRAGTVYEAELKLGKIMSVPEAYEVFTFGFTTLEQAISMQLNGISYPNIGKLTEVVLAGTLTTQDKAEAQAIEQAFAASQEGNALKVSWTHENETTHSFVIKGIVRSKTASKVEINIDPKPLEAKLGLQETVEIPALGTFNVMSVEVVYGEEPYAFIVFSDPIDPNQNLDGLVYVQDAADPRLVLDQNQLKLYPGSGTTGERELVVSEGIRNVLQQKLYPTFRQKLNFDPPKPEVRFLGKGVILPSTHEKRLPFEAISLKAVEVKVLKIYENNVTQFFQVNNFGDEYGPNELRRVGKIVLEKTIPLVNESPEEYLKWKKYALDLSEVVDAEPGAIYQVIFSFKKEHTVYPCGGGLDISPALTTLEEEKETATEEYGYDYYDDYYPEDYDYRQRENPCHNSYYAYDRSTKKRLVFASDIGIIAKRGSDQSYLFAVTDMVSAQPISGAKIEVFDYQQQIIATGESDQSGLWNAEPTGVPYFVQVSYEKQKGYLRLDDPSALPLNYFDVAGAKVQKGLKGFLYGERGVWRPGDSIFVGFILENKNAKIPSDVPVVFELTNPQGVVTSRKVATQSLRGLYTFITQTDAEAPTGRWSLTAKVGGAVFTLPIRIETIVPNRLKLVLDFNKEKISATDPSISGQLQVKWLTGLTASNLRTEAEIGWVPMETKFPAYKDYLFDNITKKPSIDKQSIFEGKIDAEGQAQITADLPDDRNVFSGMVKANIRVNVMENGGSSSTDRFSVAFSPYAYYVGMKLPETDKLNRALKTNEDHTISLVTLTENGAPASRDLEIKIFKLEWRWWWDNTENSVYMDESYMRPVQQTTVRSVAGKATFPFRVDYPEWGRYLVVVKDIKGGHSVADVVYADWPGYGGSSSGRGGASILSLSTGKESYVVGEEIKLFIPSTYKGKALVSIESGTQVLETYWTETQENGTTFTLKASEKMAPGVYAHVTMVQPHGQTTNDLPLRMYGVVPVKVENPQTVLEPTIETQPEWKPDTDVEVKVKEKNGKKMTFTLAVVDEGLLDLTKFQTPNPHTYFYAKEALGVNTWDMFDHVLGAMNTKMDRVLSIGGDGELKGGEGAKANRFKPVVRFLGPFELGSNDEKTIKFHLPNYIGSVRCMVVAGQEGAYGQAEKAVPVKKPLMVLATLPRVLGPEEEFEFPVNVFAMSPSIKQVTVSLAMSNQISAIQTASKAISFAKPGDQMVYFKLKTKDLQGVGKIKVTASSGKESSAEQLEVQIRNPNPIQTQVVEKVLQPGENWSAMLPFVGMTGTNKAVLEVSTRPPLNLGQRLDYLIQYPYGCVEQTVSSVYPQLYLPSLVPSGAISTAQIETNIKAGITRLASFQLADGSFGYWPGSYQGDEWATSYVGMFLLEAKRLGYDVPGGMLNSWKKFQSKAARQWQANRNSDLVQAQRLLGLAMEGSPELGAMNRLREYSGIGLTAKWRLALAYVLVGQEATAKTLITSPLVKPSDQAPWYHSLWSDKALALEVYFALKDQNKSETVARELSQMLSSPQYLNTLETASLLQALAKMYTAQKNSQGISIQYAFAGQSPKKESNGQTIWQTTYPEAEISKANFSIQNTSKGIQFARWVVTGKPKQGLETAVNQNLKLEIYYTDGDGNPIEPTRLVQGQTIKAFARITHAGWPSVYTNLALRQFFPAGWEIKSVLAQTQDDSGEDDPQTSAEAENEEGEEQEEVVLPQPKKKKGILSAYDYRDTRDDKVYTFFSLAPGEQKTFQVTLSASFVGKFYLPGQLVESMYLGNVNALQPGQWVEVLPAGGQGWSGK